MRTVRDHLQWRTLLLVNLHAHVDVDAGDDQVAEDVQPAHAVEDIRIFERHLLARLHHHKDDHEVCSVDWLVHVRRAAAISSAYI